MSRFLSILGIAGLIAIAMPSTAMAGGAVAAQLLPTADAIDCAVADPCESNGFGSTATLKIKGTSNMSFIMEGMLPSQMYHATINGGGLCGMENIVATFTTAADGTVNHTQALSAAPDVGDVVEICRGDADLGPLAVYDGTLGRLNGR